MLSVFKNINHFAGKQKWLDVLAVFCARILPYLVIIFLTLFAAVIRSWEILIIPLLSAFISRFVISSLIYFFYKEKRPAYSEQVNILIPVPKNPSFPSSHAAVFFAISFSLFAYNINLAIIFLVLSLIIGMARVFCGVHYFRDIVGGCVSGLLSSLIVYYLLIFIKI